METICVPTYTNIFVSDFEKKIGDKDIKDIYIKDIKDIYISRKLPFHIRLNYQREEAKTPNAQKSEPCLLEAWEIHTNWTIEQYKKYINRYFNIKTERYKEQLHKKTKYINTKF